MNAEGYHIPVLLHEAVEALQIRPGGVYVDLTFGGGGHSREILNRMDSTARLYGFDQDLDAMQGALSDDRFQFVRSNFRFLENWMQYYNETQGVDGILADLGVSSHHFDDAARGFSFRFDAPLDMRMNQNATICAADVVNEYDEQKLSDLFYLYGELKQSHRLADAIIRTRTNSVLRTTTDLAKAVLPILGRAREKKDLAKVFQALRIEVNAEMKALRKMLTASTRVLKPGGRLVVLSYHSLEDRMVKNFMKTGNPEGHLHKNFYGQILSPLRPVGKMITPNEQEQQNNPRSRSAKLRVAEKQ